MDRISLNNRAGRAAARPLRAEFTPSPGNEGHPRSNKFGVMLLGLYLFLLISRILDVSPIWWLHIPMMLLIVLVVLTLFRGQFQIAFRSKITVSFGLFTCWVLVCFPLSQWRGASIEPVTWCIQAFGLFLIIAQMPRTIDEWRKVVGAYGYAILAASLLGFYVGRSVENGRLALAGGSFADPNEFALGMVLGLPFWWYKAGRAKGPKKIFYWLCTVPIYITFAKTGSRSGLFALAALFLGAVLFAKGPRKLVICAVAAFAVILAGVLLPDYMTARYFTIFSPGGNTQLDASGRQQLNSDIGSSEGRKMLLIQSVQMTFQHPIFGVGPGVFSYASWDQRKANTGIGGLAQVTHNTYTQISSETGLPGFLLFVATLIFSFKSIYRDYRTALSIEPEVAQSGQYLIEAFIALTVGIFFLSVGYTHTTAVLFAFAVSLHNILSSTASVKTPEQSTAPLPANRLPVRKSPAPQVSVPAQLVSPRRAKPQASRNARLGVTEETDSKAMSSSEKKS
jgi:O-antigen ligase